MGASNALRPACGLSSHQLWLSLEWRGMPMSNVADDAIWTLWLNERGLSFQEIADRLGTSAQHSEGVVDAKRAEITAGFRRKALFDRAS